MKFRNLLLLSALWLGGTALSRADEDPVAPAADPLPELLLPYDVDNDGKLSVEERQAYDDSVKEAAKQNQPLQAPTLLWDTNGDGFLSPEERQAAMDAIRQKIEAERVARFDELDKDEDGKLSPAEFLGVPNLKPRVVARILNHIDANHDGFISKAEFLAALDPASVKTAQAVSPPAVGAFSPAPGLTVIPAAGLSISPPPVTAAPAPPVATPAAPCKPVTNSAPAAPVKPG